MGPTTVYISETYRDEYNFALGDTNVMRREHGVLLLVDRERHERRSRILMAAQFAIAMLLVTSFASPAMLSSGAALLFTVSVSLTTTILLYRYLQPVFFEVRLPLEHN